MTIFCVIVIHAASWGSDICRATWSHSTFHVRSHIYVKANSGTGRILVVSVVFGQLAPQIRSRFVVGNLEVQRTRLGFKLVTRSSRLRERQLRIWTCLPLVRS